MEAGQGGGVGNHWRWIADLVGSRSQILRQSTNQTLELLLAFALVSQVCSMGVHKLLPEFQNQVSVADCTRALFVRPTPYACLCESPRLERLQEDAEERVSVAPAP
jgi:hypothetical protein